MSPSLGDVLLSIWVLVVVSSALTIWAIRLLNAQVSGGVTVNIGNREAVCPKAMAKAVALPRVRPAPRPGN